MHFDRYSGELKGGWPHGRGRMIHANGDIYEGDWREGQYHGEGKLSRSSDRPSWTLEGHFAHDQADGLCRRTWADGVVFEGQYRDGYMHGRGKITYPSNYASPVEMRGLVFEGEYVNDKILGAGKAVWGDGTEFEGHFQGGYLLHGYGTAAKRVDGVIMDHYEGNFNHGKMHGHGKMMYYHGGVYEGNWENGLRHGTTTTHREGNVYTNAYARGKLVSETVNGVKQDPPCGGYGNFDSFIVPDGAESRPAAGCDIILKYGC